MRVLAFLLLFVGVAAAQTTTTAAPTTTSSTTTLPWRSCQPPGTLAIAQTGTGASARILCINPSEGARSVVFTYSTTAGTATVEIDVSCDGGTTWFPVTNSSQAIAPTTPNGYKELWPQCCYRANTTASSSGSVTVKYRCGPEIH